MGERSVNPEDVFRPQQIDGLEAPSRYRVLCDDKRNSWLDLTIGPDGDVWLSMQEWEDIDEVGSSPDPLPCIRIRSYIGGGRSLRTFNALRWLALAMKLDAEERAARLDPQPTPDEGGEGE